MCIQTSSPCANNAKDDLTTDLKDQLCVLMKGIRTLTRIVTTDDTTSSEYVDDDRRIEELQSAWRLEDTGFSGLYNACKQMKDTLSLTSLEADGALLETQKARKTAIAAKLSRGKMKKKAIALLKENSELRNRNHSLTIELRDQKKQKKLIARSVKNFFDTFTEEHQIVEAARDDVLTTHPLTLDKRVPPLPGVLSIEHSSAEEEWEEVSSASSSSVSSTSLVTDDGCASVRLAQREVDTAPSLGQAFKSRLVAQMEPDTAAPSLRNAFKSMRWNSIVPTTNNTTTTKQKNELDLSFPSAANSGIRFCAVSATKSMAGGADYSEALLVCGFTTEFSGDTVTKQRPMFGSRLVCVDGISLEREQWKMVNFNDYIASKSGGPIQMSFRNELLNKTQIKQLTESSKKKIQT